MSKRWVEIAVGAALVGVVALVNLPRFASADTNDTATLEREGLRVLRVAVELYRQDHGHYPGQTSDGTHPAGSVEAVITQLTRVTDAEGRWKPDGVGFGPYLAQGIPECPTAGRAARDRLVIAQGPIEAASSAQGWVYCPADGSLVTGR